jgi:hypothetical protein
MNSRYTAIIKIVRVDKDPGTGRGDDKSFDTEIASLVVRNSSLEKVIAAAKGHLDLVEEAE